MELESRRPRAPECLFVLLALAAPFLAHAQWQGPTTVLSLAEGHGPNQVGVSSGEEDINENPDLSCVDDRGNMVIADPHNDRIIIYGPNGSLQKAIVCPVLSGHCNPWPNKVVAHPSAQRILVSDELCVYDYDGNVHKCFANPLGPHGALYLSSIPNGFILRQNGEEWRDIPGKPGQREKYTIDDYWAVDLEGNLLGKLPERPFELGRFVEANGKKYIVFPAATIPADAFWGYGGCHLLPDGSVYCESSDTLYNSQGQEVGSFKVPPDVEPPTEGADFASYEGPVLDSQGNMYVIKYSLGHYTILKWTYVGTSQCTTTAPGPVPGPQRGGQTAQKAAGSPKARPQQAPPQPAPAQPAKPDGRK